MAVPTGTEVTRGCDDNGAMAGAGSYGELGPQAASRNAGYPEPGPRSRSFHWLSRRSWPGAYDGHCRHVGVIGCAGRLRVKADIPVTTRD